MDIFVLSGRGLIENDFQQAQYTLIKVSLL